MPENRRTIVQGEHEASADPDVVYTTVLGSCVAACMYDSYARVGGMNHFLLPGPPASGGTEIAMRRYGVHAMELLVNALLCLGATRSGLRAHVYGGADMRVGTSKIGEANARFAHQYLADEGIALAGADLGGTAARRVDFKPVAGLVRRRFVQSAPPEKATPVAGVGGGDVTLF